MSKQSSLLGALTSGIAVAQGTLFLSGFRLTADDVEFSHVAMFGPEEIVRTGLAAALAQGRIGQLFTYPLSALGSAFAENLWFRLGYTILHFGVLLLFAQYVSRVTDKSITIITFLVMLSIQPLGFFHLPPNSFPLIASVPMALILLARIMVHALRGKEISPRVSLLFWHGGALFASLLYEAAFAFYLACMFFELGIFLLSKKEKESVQRYIRSVSADLWVASLSLAIYASFRLLNPSTYEGNIPNPIIDPLAIGKTALGHIWGGTSFASYLREWSVLAGNSSSLVVQVIGVLIAAFTGWAVFLAWGNQSSGPSRSQSFWLGVSALSIVGALTVSAPYAITAKYQEWCQDINSCVYLDSRISFPFAALFLVVILMSLAERFSSSLLAKRLTMILLSTSIGAIAWATFITNSAISDRMDQYVQPWIKAKEYACLELDHNSDIPVEDFVDPNDQLSLHPTFDAHKYWTNYIQRFRDSEPDCSQWV